MTSSRTITLVSFFMTFASMIEHTWGHGRLLLPPSRASAFRLGYKTPADYNDVECNCGGFNNQWNVNGGKCGLCGDPWQQSPRAHERPDGQFVSKNMITLSTYKEGDLITFGVELTANHKGYFQFSICKVDDLPGQVEATQECLDRTILNLTTGGTDYPADQGNGKYSPQAYLPTGLVCNHCVLRWKYHCGNNWGCDKTGTCGQGLAPEQEEFYSCSDIKIEPRNGTSQTTAAPATTTTAPSTTTTTVPSTTRNDVTTSAISTTTPFDPYPLSESDKNFYKCNECMRRLYSKTRSYSADSDICANFTPRACPR